MGALVPGLDDQVEYLMTAAPLADDSELTRWLEAVRTACPGEETRSVDDFARAFREAAREWQSTTVDTFVLAVGQLSDGVGTVRKYARTLQESPGTYWQLRQAQTAPVPAPSDPTQPVDRFGWLADGQRTALAAAWGDQWQGYLGQQLDYRWGVGWEATYATAASQGYLDQLIAEWIPQQQQQQQQSGGGSAPVEEEVRLTPDELVQIADAAVRDCVQTVPGAETLSEAEIADVIAAVRAEMTGSAM